MSILHFYHIYFTFNVVKIYKTIWQKLEIDIKIFKV